MPPLASCCLCPNRKRIETTQKRYKINQPSLQSLFMSYVHGSQINYDLDNDVICARCRLNIRKPTRQKVNGGWKYSTKEDMNQGIIQDIFPDMTTENKNNSQIPGTLAKSLTTNLLHVPSTPFATEDKIHEMMDTGESEAEGHDTEMYTEESVTSEIRN